MLTELTLDSGSDVAADASDKLRWSEWNILWERAEESRQNVLRLHVSRQQPAGAARVGNEPVANRCDFYFFHRDSFAALDSDKQAEKMWATFGVSISANRCSANHTGSSWSLRCVQPRDGCVLIKISQNIHCVMSAKKGNEFFKIYFNSNINLLKFQYFKHFSRQSSSTKQRCIQGDQL